jgi:transcriptional regulator with XRE-family HTH domain
MGNGNGNTLGGRIRAARQKRGLTVRALAEVSDVPAGNISRVERGDRGLRDYSLSKIAKALRVSQRSLRGKAVAR